MKAIRLTVKNRSKSKLALSDESFIVVMRDGGPEIVSSRRGLAELDRSAVASVGSEDRPTHIDLVVEEMEI